jgi:hypothetical protein
VWQRARGAHAGLQDIRVRQNPDALLELLLLLHQTTPCIPSTVAHVEHQSAQALVLGACTIGPRSQAQCYCIPQMQPAIGRCESLGLGSPPNQAHIERMPPRPPQDPPPLRGEGEVGGGGVSSCTCRSLPCSLFHAQHTHILVVGAWCCHKDESRSHQQWCPLPDQGCDVTRQGGLVVTAQPAAGRARKLAGGIFGGLLASRLGPAGLEEVRQ